MTWDEIQRLGQELGTLGCTRCNRVSYGFYFYFGDDEYVRLSDTEVWSCESSLELAGMLTEKLNAKVIARTPQDIPAWVDMWERDGNAKRATQRDAKAIEKLANEVRSFTFTDASDPIDAFNYPLRSLDTNLVASTPQLGQVATRDPDFTIAFDYIDLQPGERTFMGRNATRVYTFPSRTRGGVSYETILWDAPDAEKQMLSCNCPGWINKKPGKQRRCKHTEQAVKDAMGFAREVAPRVQPVATRYGPLSTLPPVPDYLESAFGPGAYASHQAWLLEVCGMAGHNPGAAVARRLERPGLKVKSAVLDRVFLMNALLPRAEFANAQLFEANFAGADLNSADFTYAMLNRGNFTGAKLDNATFYGAKLVGTIGLDYNLGPEMRGPTTRQTATAMEMGAGALPPGYRTTVGRSIAALENSSYRPPPKQSPKSFAREAPASKPKAGDRKIIKLK